MDLMLKPLDLDDKRGLSGAGATPNPLPGPWIATRHRGAAHAESKRTSDQPVLRCKSSDPRRLRTLETSIDIMGGIEYATMWLES
jgi:hypothetical protein